MSPNLRAKGGYTTFGSPTGLVQYHKSSSFKAKAVALGLLLAAIGAFVGLKGSQAWSMPQESVNIESTGSAKSDVGTCTDGSACTSGICGGGFCCTYPKGTSEGCTDCFSKTDGDCKKCAANFYRKSYSCTACPPGYTSESGSESADDCEVQRTHVPLRRLHRLMEKP